MKYLSKDSVLQAFEECRNKTQNKFWGLVSILRVLEERIIPANSYSFAVENVQSFLEDLFRLEENKKSYFTSNKWSVIFSNQWIDNVPEQMLDGKPNVYCVAAWYFRRTAFAEEITSEQVVGSFLDLIHLTKEDAQKWFSFNPSQFTFESTLYSENDLLDAIVQKVHVSPIPTNLTLSFEGQTFIKSNPGSLGQAPFIQTLYANQGIQKCLILTQFDFQELYPYNQNPISRKLQRGTDNVLDMDKVGVEASVNPFITAIRTKPFILLAGISGTGKSRIVRKLAQATDDIDNFANDEERFSCHTPSNFCLIQVKPNWHNSMDVVGFKSNIGGEHYEYTPFVEFIAKAWQHQDTPFFLCLDEMNLAPVEEYFAEFLSAIESRSVGSNGEYETDPVIKPFDGFGEKVRKDMLDHLIGTVNASDIDANSEKGKLVKRFREKGLTLPKNLIVMGTVNMDETTFSFSRKVLDRAMSIEMNEVNYDEFLSGTTENDIPVLVERNHDLVDRFVSAQDVKGSIEAEEVKGFLVSVNALLEGTPFKLGYRAANEAMLYVAAAKTFGNDNLASALDDFTMMKILSRIEGDESKLRTKDGDELLDKLYELFEKRFSGLEKSKTLTKLEQMQRDLKRDHFVSFWG